MLYSDESVTQPSFDDGVEHVIEITNTSTLPNNPITSIQYDFTFKEFTSSYPSDELNQTKSMSQQDYHSFTEDISSLFKKYHLQIKEGDSEIIYGSIALLLSVAIFLLFGIFLVIRLGATYNASAAGQGLILFYLYVLWVPPLTFFMWLYMVRRKRNIEIHRDCKKAVSVLIERKNVELAGRYRWALVYSYDVFLGRYEMSRPPTLSLYA